MTKKSQVASVKRKLAGLISERDRLTKDIAGCRLAQNRRGKLFAAKAEKEADIAKVKLFLNRLINDRHPRFRVFAGYNNIETINRRKRGCHVKSKNTGPAN